MTDSETSIADRVTARPVSEAEDDPFLQDLYISTRDDLAGLFPDPEQVRQLVLIQYRGQQMTYSQQFPDASHEVLLLDGQPVGRIMVARRPNEIYFIDIALVPAARNLGIGSLILTNLIGEGSTSGLPVVLHVLKTNRAQLLYRRHGFEVVSDDGVHLFMKRLAD